MQEPPTPATRLRFTELYRRSGTESGQGATDYGPEKRSFTHRSLPPE